MNDNQRRILRNHRALRLQASQLPWRVLTPMLVVAAISSGCFDPSMGWMLLGGAVHADAADGEVHDIAHAKAAPASTSVFDGYPSLTELQTRISTLASRHADRATLTSVATTAGGRAVPLLTLAARGSVAPERRTAILLVAGLDAGHRCGPVVAVNLAQKLLDGASAASTAPASQFLTEHTLYVLPVMNPDRLALLAPANAASTAPAEPSGGNLRPMDDDRDVLVNEDPPEDIDGDGRITWMRVRGRNRTHCVDAGEPRLSKRADPLKGESPEFEILSEGIDNDGDGSYNEDGAGGVNLAANFPHLYRANLPDSGPHQVSEPETRGLADFVLAHPNIVAVIVFGPHDNISKPPPGGKPDPTGQSFRELHPDDAALYGEFSKRFVEATGLKDSRGADTEGAFHAWCYSQRGMAAFATTLWQPPAEGPPAAAPASPASAASSAASSSESTNVGPTTSGPADGADGAASRPASAPAAPASPKKDDVPAEVAEARRWLAYSDRERMGAGHAEWKPFNHPTLGNIDIGGFVAGFMMNPPAAALADIADKQAAFLLDLGSRLPRVAVEQVIVTSPGAGVYALEMWVVNNGYLPTALAMAKKAGKSHPIVIRPQLPAERIIGGGRMEKIEALAGSGGRERRRWLVLGTEGERVTFTLFHAPVGEFEHSVTLPARDK